MKPKPEDTFHSHNSASLAEAERRIKALEEENSKLKCDLADVSSLYNVLIKDRENGSVDERRVNLLKSQLVQLERQVLLLTESLGCRADTLLEVENGLHDIVEITRSHMVQEKGAVTVPRDGLKKIVETSESCRIKLAKNIETSNPERYFRPLLMMDKFIKQSPDRDVSLFDVCSGSTEHINLKHVAKLESKLMQVFHQLTSLQHSLGTGFPRAATGHQNIHASGEVRTACQVSRACDLMKEATADLLELSLLVPSAPWPVLKTPLFKDITTEDVLTSLPNFPKSRSVEGQQKIEALMKAYNYIITVKDTELRSLHTELQYHTAVRKCQQDYIQSLLDSMKMAYIEFENNTNDILCKPLKEIMNAYSRLEQRASESDLRDFLSAFKQHAPDILVALNQLEKNRDDKAGVDALSSFGEQFFESIEKLHSECIGARDKAAAELDQVKAESKEYETEFRQLFPSAQKSRTGEQATADYRQIVEGTADLGIGAKDVHGDSEQALRTPTSTLSAESADSTAAASARSRRRAAKIATGAESPKSVPVLPAQKGAAEASVFSDSIADTETVDSDVCSCGADADNAWEASLRRYTPDLSTPEQAQGLAKSKPPLGPIKPSKFLAEAESPTSSTKKLLPSRLPRAQAKLSSTSPVISKTPRTPQSGEKPKTPKSITPQARLTLKPRSSRSHSLDNSGEQGLSLLNQSSESIGSSPYMKRSSSLSQRPDWVT